MPRVKSKCIKIYVTEEKKDLFDLAVKGLGTTKQQLIESYVDVVVGHIKPVKTTDQANHKR